MRRDSFALGSGLFLRLLALVHVVAFVSFWTQAAGLIGPRGLLPAGRLLAVLHRQYGAGVYWQLPTLCWLFGAGHALAFMAAAGIALAILLFFGIAPALCLALLWVDYLSLCCVGQIFFDYQWDALLLETTLLAIFLAPWSLRPGWRRLEPPPIGRWLLVWLLFRLMLLSGVVKLASHDPTWANLTALTYHYQTQPLPTPLAWYANLLPLWLQRLSCALMFLIELGAPWCLFLPRRWRHPAVLSLIGLQVLIAATGNYTYFNLLTIALCLLCLDDAWWDSFRRSPAPEGRAGRLVPPSPTGGPSRAALPQKPIGLAAEEARTPPKFLLIALAIFVVAFTTLEAAADLFPVLPDDPDLARLFKPIQWVAPFRSLNNYGLFASMTTTRPELIIQGSDDGRDWRPYELPHKPGNLGRPPDFVAPFQPRLDWQLWFAALESPENNRWVAVLCVHLLRGTPEVLGLFAVNPFPTHPPQFIRVVRYQYEFTTRAERARTGHWWKREVLDFYVPQFSLSAP